MFNIGACFIVVYYWDKVYQIPFTASPFQRYSFRVVEGRSSMTRDIDRDVIRENEPGHIAYISFFELQGPFHFFFP